MNGKSCCCMEGGGGSGGGCWGTGESFRGLVAAGRNERERVKRSLSSSSTR